MAENNQPSIILCPYCGHIQQLDHKCEACGGYFDRLSLKATQVAMGPWFIHNPKKPFKPGCSYDVIKKQAAAGRIHNRTIMRGPTTRQFWSFAKNVPGVAHLIGYCHNCGASVTPTDAKCHKCNAPFREVALRNEMGLLYPTPQEAAKAQEQLDRETNPATASQHKEAKASASAGASAQAAESAGKPAGEDLLDEVIGRVEKQTGGKAPRAGATPKPAASANTGQAAKPTPAAAAAATPQAAVAPAQAVELGEIDDEEDHVAPGASHGNKNTVLIVLLVLGILLVLTVQVLMYGYNNGWFADNGPSSASSLVSSESARSSSLISQIETAVANSAAEQPAAARPPAPATTGATAPARTETSTSAATTATAPAKTPSAAPAATPAPAPAPAAPAANPEVELRERFQQALRLESQNKLKESLAILEDIKKKTPISQIPKEMHDAIQRIQAKIAQQSSQRLFDTP